MKLRRISVVLALGFLIALTGCLKTRAQLRSEESSATESEDRVSAAKAAPENVNGGGQYAIDEIKSEFTRLSGRVEDLERTQKQSPAGPKPEDLKKLETRITELEQAQASMLEAIKKMQAAPPAPADPAELLDRAREQMEGGNFEGAVENLSTYLRSPKAKKAEEATFMRAESYYAMKEYKKAIVDYSKFPEKFTRSPYMPRALFKIGLSFEALGMKEDAKGFYQELLEKFPKSPEAKKVSVGKKPRR
jgi:TolA-binding protein